MIAVSPTLPAQPADVGGLIEASFRVWRASLRGCFGLAVAPSLISLLPALWMPSPEDPLQALEALSGWLQRPSVWLLYLALTVLNLLCLSAIAYRMGMLGRGQDPGLIPSLNRAIERLPAALLGWLLYGLALLLGLAAALAVPTALVAGGASAPVIALGALASALLLAPPTWLSLAAGLFLYATVLERRGGIDSLRRSMALMRGHWWRSSAVIGVVLLVYMLLASAAALFAALLAGAVSVALGGLAALQQGGWVLGLQLLLAPVSAVLQLLVIAGGLAMFSDLVLRANADPG